MVPNGCELSNQDSFLFYHRNVYNTTESQWIWDLKQQQLSDLINIQTDPFYKC